MSFKTIVTLGPAILDNDKLTKINTLGDCIYRINGAHVNEKQVMRLTDQVKKVLPDALIMLDLPGNKIRTGVLSEPIRLIKNDSFILHDYQVNYPEFSLFLKKGDIIRANDSIFTMEVIEVNKNSVRLMSHSDGLLHSNKGLHVRGIHKDIPFLFEKDYSLIEIANNSHIEYLSLSFVRTKDDICEAKKALKNNNTHLIAKIETQAAVNNLHDIFQEVESILVDRGDLSTEIDIIKLASVQEEIVSRALKAEKNIYLATQFLKNMEKNSVPLISEIIDLCRTVKSGISGIQLSDETAIGRYPLESIELVFSAFKNSLE